MSCLRAWIENAPALYKALHTLSLGGPNQKDSPSRLLKWIAAGVAENGVGESANVSEMNALDNLGKLSLRNPLKVAPICRINFTQLTTTLRIFSVSSLWRYYFQTRIGCQSGYASDSQRIRA